MGMGIGIRAHMGLGIAAGLGLGDWGRQGHGRTMHAIPQLGEKIVTGLGRRKHLLHDTRFVSHKRGLDRTGQEGYPTVFGNGTRFVWYGGVPQKQDGV